MPMLSVLAVGMNPDMQHKKDESNLATYVDMQYQ